MVRRHLTAHAAGGRPPRRLLLHVVRNGPSSRGWRRLRAGGSLRFPHRSQSIDAEIEKHLCASHVIPDEKPRHRRSLLARRRRARPLRRTKRSFAIGVLYGIRSEALECVQLAAALAPASSLAGTRACGEGMRIEIEAGVEIPARQLAGGNCRKQACGRESGSELHALQSFAPRGRIGPRRGGADRPPSRRS